MSVSQGSKILASDCVSTNTASTLVLRDSSGNFSAGTITSLLTSNRTTVGNYISLQQDTTEVGSLKLETLGAANTEGWTTLILGNATAETAAKNTSGKIILYNSNGDRITLQGSYGKPLFMLGDSNHSLLTFTNGIMQGTFCGNFSGTLSKKVTATGDFVTMYQNSRPCAQLKIDSLGPANTEGLVKLLLGNNMGKENADNASGKLVIYKNSVGEYITLYQNDRLNSVVCGNLTLETLGPANTEGIVTLTLGNNKAKTVANNASGKIELYDADGNVSTINSSLKTVKINPGLKIYTDKLTASSSTIEKTISEVVGRFNTSEVKIYSLTLTTKVTANQRGEITLWLGNTRAISDAANCNGVMEIVRGTTGTFLRTTSGLQTCSELSLSVLGAVGTEGIMNLSLGNNLTTTSANNASGKITLFNSLGNYTDMSAQNLTWPGGLGSVTSLQCTNVKMMNGWVESELVLGTNWQTTKPSGTTISTSPIARILPPYYGSNYCWRIYAIDDSANAYLDLTYHTTTLVQIRHDGATKGLVTKVDTGNKTFTSSTSWFYTGASVTIPAYCYYFIRGQAVYANSGPTRVAFSTNSNAAAGWEQVVSCNGGQGYSGYISICGYTTAQTIFYLHAMYNGATSNWARITGGYIQSWE